MKKLIFSFWCVTEQTSNFDAVQKYQNELIKNKQEYAEKVGAEYKHITTTDKKDFIDVNNFKHKLMKEFAEEFDKILYVDMDVIFQTEEDIFQLPSDKIWAKESFFKKGFFTSDHMRSPYQKRKELSKLLGYTHNTVWNTGIVLASSEMIKKLDWENPDNVNNETWFTYLVVTKDIPCEDMGDWNLIVHSRISQPYDDIKKMKSLHLINKNFSFFFEKKKRCVFSMFIEIPVEDICTGNSKDPWHQKQKYIKSGENFSKYNDLLIKNKKKYCDEIGVDFKHFAFDQEFVNFKDSFKHEMSDYNIINFWKLKLFEKLFEEYDEVLYLDHDVIVKDKTNFFMHENLQEEFSCTFVPIEEHHQLWVDRLEPIHFRDPLAKFLNANAMCEIEGIEIERKLVANTGIVAFSKQMWDEFGFFEDFESNLALMKELKEEDMGFHPYEKDCFGFDNEALFTFIQMKKKLPISKIGVQDWHARVHLESESIADSFPDAVQNETLHFIHLISKEFWRFFDEDFRSQN